MPQERVFGKPTANAVTASKSADKINDASTGTQPSSYREASPARMMPTKSQSSVALAVESNQSVEATKSPQQKPRNQALEALQRHERAQSSPLLPYRLPQQSLAEVKIEHPQGQRDLFKQFCKWRTKHIESVQLEVARLDNRLQRLIAIHATDAVPSRLQRPGSQLSIQSSDTLPRAQSKKQLEQQLVTWQDDALATHCNYCMRPFPSVPFAMFAALTQLVDQQQDQSTRHHCRLCGLVFCGRKTCSSLVTVPMCPSQLRICQECNLKIIVRRMRSVSTDSKQSLLLKLYAEFKRVERELDAGLLKFNDSIVKLQGLTARQIKQDARLTLIQDGAQLLRQRLLSHFTKYDQMAKAIKNLPPASTLEQRLHLNIHIYAMNYLATHMFTLKLLPDGQPEKQVVESQSSTPLPVMKRATFSLSALFSPTESTEQLQPRVLSSQEQEQIAVLEEQLQQLTKMLAGATRARQFDDVRALQQSVDELAQELVRLRT